ncbi:MAG: AI-2E family transporter [Candidatus Gracilibacteria bacterium]|nr:AI-2E family transporter [Candidatus Gracilibacteria bacterium]
MEFNMKKNEYKVFFFKVLIFLGILLISFILFSVYNIILILMFAIFLNILFAPFLNKLNKKKVPDWLGIILVYIFILLTIIILFSAIIPIFAGEIGKFANNLTAYIGTIQENYKIDGVNGLGLPKYITDNFSPILSRIDFNTMLDALKANFLEIGNFFTKNLSNFVINGIGIVSSITGAFFNLMLTFIFAFFIALERKDIKNFFYKITPRDLSKYLEKKEDIIMSTLNNWLKGQIILSISIFTFTVIGLNIIRIFGVNISFGETLTLGLIAGIMEFIPYIGPFIALLPAIAIAGSLGLESLVIVIILYVIIQQLENNVLVPYIMSKATKVSPFAVLLAMSLGASLFGILGILVTVPVVSVVQIFLDDYLKGKK